MLLVELRGGTGGSFPACLSQSTMPAAVAGAQVFIDLLPHSLPFLQGDLKEEFHEFRVKLSTCCGTDFLPRNLK